MSYSALFAKLWEGYIKSNPQAEKIYDLFTQLGEHVVNDHIALRTFNDPQINIEVLAKAFLQYGYKECGQYNFPAKKLFAKHYEHADPEAPKVFISELKVEEFSHHFQAIVRDSIEKIPERLLSSPQLIYSGATWQPLSYKVYQKLLAESEYAAWLYAFGFCANHFTVNVNALTHLQTIEQVNELLTQHDFKLNVVGGAIKGTPNEFLEQSSTLAGEVDVSFMEGIFKIPSCYYEFAKRYPLADGKLYSGFVANSADKIFESTDAQAS